MLIAGIICYLIAFIVLCISIGNDMFDSREKLAAIFIVEAFTLIGTLSIPIEYGRKLEVEKYFQTHQLSYKPIIK